MYGMGFKTDLQGQAARLTSQSQAQQMFAFYQRKYAQLQPELLSHRELIRRITQYGLQKI
jgi:tryptophan halogenase